MAKSKYDLSIGNEFLTRQQLTLVMGLPKHTVDRLIATGELIQYRSGSGIGRGGQRVFYARSQVQRVKAQLNGRKRKERRA